MIGIISFYDKPIPVRLLVMFVFNYVCFEADKLESKFMDVPDFL